MGKNNGINSWLNAVKKAFRSPSDDDKRGSSSRRREENEQDDDEETKRGKRRWIFRKHHQSPLETTIQHTVPKAAGATNSDALSISVSDQRRAIAVAVATAAAAEAAVATAQAAVELIRLTRPPPPPPLKQHKAALLIQTIFRAYLARRALLALKGVVKLQALIRGYTVRKRAKTTLQCIESLIRVQALVCDQRRRLSCEATNLDYINSRNRDRPSCNLEIEGLIQRADECSLRQGRTLARILYSHQMQSSEDRYLEEIDQDGVRKDWSLCSTQKDAIKTVEIDTSRPYLYASPRRQEKNRNGSVHSPKTPSSSKTESIQAHSSCSSPCYQVQRMSTSESCCGSLARPSYMAATASAMARVRSHSTPRQRLSSPRREQTTPSAKKRLSFPVSGGSRAADHQFGLVQSFNVPDYSTE